MLKTLKQYNEKIAAGLLARAGLSLSETIENSDIPLVPDEPVVVSGITDEISKELSVDPKTETGRAAILEYIDSELKAIGLGRPEYEILKDLGRSGRLPSDLYQIEIIPNIRDFYKVYFRVEVDNIYLAIKKPDSEEHFRQDEIGDSPGDISIFMKKFVGDYPFNDFNLLVVGERQGMKFFVHQVFRLYDDLREFTVYAGLVRFVHTFAENFGIAMEFEGRSAKFFVAQEVLSENQIKFNVMHHGLLRDKNGQTKVSFSHFTHQEIGSKKRLAMMVAYDIVRYEKYLNKHGVKLT